MAFGAFDGYFATAERLISMRVQGITASRLRVEDAEAVLAGKNNDQQKAVGQQAKDRDHLDKQRSELSTQIAQIDQQIAATQEAAKAEEAQYPDKVNAIKEACKIVAYACVGPRLEAAEQHRREAQANTARELDRLQAAKADLNAKFAALDASDQSKVDPANRAVKDAEAKLTAARQDFDTAVLTSQVYRWAGAWYGKSPREVTAEEANRVLDTFAAVVALAYVLTQILLSISYYGRKRRGVVETNREFLRERVNHAWERVIGARRAYWVRKRRGVYRDRIREVPVTEYRDREVTKEVFVPTAERTKVIYVPVPPGGPVPPAEEFVRKANFEGTL